MFSSKSDVAYAELRGRILTGTLAPGSRLDQYEVAQAMDMSITPIREAIRRLSGEGLIHLGSHRSASIAGISATEARELFEVRLLLDPGAAVLAAERRTPDDIGEMRATAGRLLPVTGPGVQRPSPPTERSTERSIWPPTMTPWSGSSTTSGTSPIGTAVSGWSCHPATNPAPATTVSTTSCSS